MKTPNLNRAETCYGTKIRTGKVDRRTEIGSKIVMAAEHRGKQKMGQRPARTDQGIPKWETRSCAEESCATQT
jgi:hypothetical protein